MGLKEKLKEKIALNRENQVDWDKRKEEWISAISELNDQIRSYFYDYERDGLLEFEIEKKTITEEYLGKYEVDVLILNFKNTFEIHVEPIGTLIIGAWARFDIYARGYNSGKYFILRQKNNDGDFCWMVVNPENKRETNELSKELLEQIFEKWLS